MRSLLDSAIAVKKASNIISHLDTNLKNKALKMIANALLIH